MTELKLKDKKKKTTSDDKILISRKKIRFIWEKDDGNRKDAVLPAVRIESEVMAFLDKLPGMKKSKGKI